ncbi:MAG: class I SAM-dependent methyltransferase [Bryobacteraceae bacterium]|nr:class I SAM-dependent methyltransferase [Bryobacteraceae bacterium]
MADLSQVEQRMREDWNARAGEDAYYYVAFGRRDQADPEFDATGAEVVAGLEWELKRVPTAHPRSRRALEIGCGPGRLLRPMAKHFGEIHGVDVADAMIARARERLAGTPHAHAHVGSGSGLPQFADASFDYVYSFAVFQHIPSRDVVFNYLEETVRVLKPNGLVRAQLNGLPPEARVYDTWSGVRVTPGEVRDFCRVHGLLLLALEGQHTQYMWTTWHKPDASMQAAPLGQVRVRRITNADSSEPVAPASGRWASISVWIEGLPPMADLLSLDLRIDGHSANLTYLGRPEADGLRQLNAILPTGLSTGLNPVTLLWRGQALADSRLRIVPTPPPVPRVIEASDGVDLLSGRRVVSGSIKLFLEECAHPEQIEIRLNGEPQPHRDVFCTDPMPPRHEVNFRVPDHLPAGPLTLDLQYHARRFAPLHFELVRA